MIKKDRYYTFMIVPHDASGKTVSFRLPLNLIYTVLGVSALIIVLASTSFIYSSMLSRRLFNYSNAIAKNREQKQVIESFSTETQKVNQAIDELVKMDNQIRQVLGLRSWKNKIQLTSKFKSWAPKAQSVSVSDELRQAKQELTVRKQSLEELKAWVAKVQSRYATLPSCWPINGPIVSRFGYRYFPWNGFHAGIDISASYGAPVRTTANGVVSFTGWRQGYGKTVVIDHGNGISTLYGHNSKFAVATGQKVQRGQVICYVGTTGLSTGPHVHYEVRKRENAVNPIAYLNINMLSASRLLKGE